MTFDTGAPASDVKLVLEYTSVDGGVHKTEIPASQFEYASGYKAYSAKLTTIAAKDVRSVVSAKVYKGSTQISNELLYSIQTYAFNQINKPTIEEAFKDLARNLMKYGISAANYFKK